MPTASLRQNWRQAIGLDCPTEQILDSVSRRPYLKKLYYLVLARLREAHAAQLDGRLDAEITPFWTPIPGLCADLGIAPTTLNRLLKEFCGLTAQVLYDRLRCEMLELDRKIADDVAQFIRSDFVPGSSGWRDEELDLKKQQLKFWRALRDHRLATPGWDNAAWARKFGFSSYTRFHRAFTLAFGKTPLEHEAHTMHEAALYFRAAHSLYRRREWADDKRLASAQGFKVPDEDYPTGGESFDHYVQMRSENPVWWNQQRERYGLARYLRNLEEQLIEQAAQFNPDRLNADPSTVCTRETKTISSNPPTHPLNPWPIPPKADIPEPRTPVSGQVG